MIALVALVCAAPFVSAWVAYYFIQPSGGKSYGELLPVEQVLSDEARIALGGDALKGKWNLLQRELYTCDAGCPDALYASRQARTMLGKDKDRLVRVLMVKSPPSEVVAQHPDLLVRPQVDRIDMIEPFRSSVMLIDPLGNQVILWPKNPDIKKMNKDLARLLRASRIG